MKGGVITVTWDDLRSKKELQYFLDYCLDHPHERFWQALRNWSGYNFIYANDEFCNDCEDTFYWDGSKLKEFNND